MPPAYKKTDKVIRKYAFMSEKKILSFNKNTRIRILIDA